MQRVAEVGAMAGLPPGVFNVISGDGEVVGRHLGEHPDVDVLTFTGSTEVGRNFMRYSADSNLKRVYLELGGKSPNIIFPDAPDLEAAADAAAWAVYFNSGEMCTAGSRLVVHAEVAEQVLERITKLADGSFQIDGTLAGGNNVNQSNQGNVGGPALPGELIQRRAKLAGTIAGQHRHPAIGITSGYDDVRLAVSVKVSDCGRARIRSDRSAFDADLDRQRRQESSGTISKKN